MNNTRFPSFLGSLCLHLGVLVLVILWPVPDNIVMPKEPGRFLPGIITIGKGGAVKSPQKPVQQEQAAEAPAAVEAPQVAPVQPLANAAETPPQPVEPEPTIAPVPVLKEPEVVKPKEPEPIPVEPTKPEPVKPEPPKPEPKKPEPKKPEPPKPEAKKPEPKKPTPKPKGQSLNSALADLAKNTPQSNSAPAGQGLDQAMASLSQELGDSSSQAEGDGGMGGGDGVGILGVYEDSVVSRIRPNWSRPERADRKQYTAVVNIKIAPTGLIQESRIVRSSGDSLFDASVLRAVRATTTLEPPPNPEAMDMNINFNSEMLGAE